MLLGDLGADVIKVEPPEGDATRAWGPPWVGTGTPEAPRTAAYFLAVNRNKRSIRLDLKQPAGADVLRAAAGPRRHPGRELPGRRIRAPRLRYGDARGAQPGSRPPRDLRLRPDRPGRRPARLRLRHPGGQWPDVDHGGRRRRGHEGGGDRPRAANRPRSGVAISDVVTGMLGAVSVLAALVGRERAEGPASGRGQRIDISLLGATLASLVNQAQNAFATGVAPGRLGNAHPNIVPYETFATSDGAIAIAVGSERQWPRVCAALDLAELATDPRFATNGDRVERRAALRPILAERFSRRSTGEWRAVLDAAQIPNGPINDIVEAFASPEAAALGMTVEQEHPAWGVIRQVGIPFALSGTPATIRTPPPTLGEDTDEILARARLRSGRDRGAARRRGRLTGSGGDRTEDLACSAAWTALGVRGGPLLDSAGSNRDCWRDPNDRRPRALGADPRRLVRDGRGDRPGARRRRLQHLRDPSRLPGRAGPRRGGQGRRSRRPGSRRCTST